jgi:DNA primase
LSLKPLSDAQRAALELATESYHQQLWDNERVLNYVRSRGITDDTIRDFRLGAVTDPIDDSHRKFLGGLVIPNVCGGRDPHVVGIKVRNLDPEAKTKYNQPSHQVARIFNLRALNTVRTFVGISEGELDSVILSQAGIPAVAIPGANNWAPYRARIFDGLEIIQFVDNDEAGQALVRAMADMRNVTLRYPERPAKDVNDQWLQLGQDESTFRAWALGLNH